MMSFLVCRDTMKNVVSPTIVVPKFVLQALISAGERKFAPNPGPARVYG